MKDYYKLSIDETLNELSADPAGLSSEKRRSVWRNTAPTS